MKKIYTHMEAVLQPCAGLFAPRFYWEGKHKGVCMSNSNMLEGSDTK